MEIKIENLKKRYINEIEGIERDYAQIEGLTEVISEAFSKDDEITTTVFGYAEHLNIRARILSDTASITVKFMALEQDINSLKHNVLYMYNNLMKDMETFLSMVKIFVYVADELGISKCKNGKYYMNTLEALATRTDTSKDSLEFLINAFEDEEN